MFLRVLYLDLRVERRGLRISVQNYWVSLHRKNEIIGFTDVCTDLCVEGLHEIDVLVGRGPSKSRGKRIGGEKRRNVGDCK